jgi:hypothetical protein
MNESNFVATLKYPGSRNYYLTPDGGASGSLHWRRDWEEHHYGGLHQAFCFPIADALLEKAKATPYPPGGTLLVKTIYEARADEISKYPEIHEAVGLSLISRRLSRAEQDVVLKETEPTLNRYLLNIDKEADWQINAVEHPRLKEIKANRYDVNVWFMERNRGQ